jgi:ATP-dependent RNA helicase RhlE
VRATGAPIPTFDDFGLAAPLLAAIRDMGYSEPTPIQQQAIPLAITGRDLIGSASTGTGKTAAFLLPILQQLVGTPPGKLAVLVLSPTRELALQIDEQALALGYHLGFSSVSVVGGMDMGPQEEAIKAGAEIIVATPGRLLDHIAVQAPRPGPCEFLVLDEADRMLDMGFMPDIKRIVAKIPKERQTMLFSATMPPEIRRLADEILRDPVTVAVDAQKPRRRTSSSGRSRSGTRARCPCCSACSSTRRCVGDRVRQAQERRRRLAQPDRPRGPLGGEPSTPTARRRSATRRSTPSAAARARCWSPPTSPPAGIDVDGVTHVVHFDVPRSSEDYIHRSGRTARGGATGEVLTFVARDEEGDFAAIEKAIGSKVPRFTVKGFDAGADEPAKRRAAPRSGSRRT